MLKKKKDKVSTESRLESLNCCKSITNLKLYLNIKVTLEKEAKHGNDKIPKHRLPKTKNV